MTESCEQHRVCRCIFNKLTTPKLRNFLWLNLIAVNMFSSSERQDWKTFLSCHTDRASMTTVTTDTVSTELSVMYYYLNMNVGVKCHFSVTLII